MSTQSCKICICIRSIMSVPRCSFSWIKQVSVSIQSCKYLSHSCVKYFYLCLFSHEKYFSPSIQLCKIFLSMPIQSQKYRSLSIKSCHEKHFTVRLFNQVKIKIYLYVSVHYAVLMSGSLYIQLCKRQVSLDIRSCAQNLCLI